MSIHELTNIIGGRHVEPATDRRLTVVDPATEEAYASTPDSSAADVDAAFAAARGAFEVWGETTPSERQRALLRIADAIESRAEEIADVEVRDTGKPRARIVDEEILVVADEFRFFAGAARTLEGRAAAEYERGHTSWIRREPIGVIGQITPWNYPLMMATWKVAPALAAGNAIVLKPAETTPASTLLLGEIAAEFLPAGTLNVITGGRDTGEAVVAHPAADMVAITGSVRAGIEVARTAADRLARVHLELGGKAPAVVFEDADLDAAAEGLVGTAFYNAGQDCTAPSRILVQEPGAEEFLERFSTRARESALTGDPRDERILFGPLNSAGHLERVQGFLDRLPDSAEIVLGGHRTGERGYFHEATIVTGIAQADEIVQSEVFGPVVTVQTFRDEEEAIRLANGVDYGLTSSVWTRDHARALRLSKRLDAGCVWINTHMVLPAEMPHGGVKRSGYGKDLSMYGFEDYTRVKHVMSAL